MRNKKEAKYIVISGIAIAVVACGLFTKVIRNNSKEVNNIVVAEEAIPETDTVDSSVTETAEKTGNSKDISNSGGDVSGKEQSDGAANNADGSSIAGTESVTAGIGTEDNETAIVSADGSNISADTGKNSAAANTTASNGKGSNGKGSGTTAQGAADPNTNTTGKSALTETGSNNSGDSQDESQGTEQSEQTNNTSGKKTNNNDSGKTTTSGNDPASSEGGSSTGVDQNDRGENGGTEAAPIGASIIELPLDIVE